MRLTIEKIQQDHTNDTETFLREDWEQFFSHFLEEIPNEEAKIVSEGSIGRQVELPEIVFELYKKLSEKYGTPRNAGNEPNPTMLYHWALIKKYSFGLRYRVTITSNGVMKYRI